MAKQILVAANGLDDAQRAIKQLRQVCSPEDEVVLLTLLEEPEAEFIGTRPSGQVMPPPYTGAAGSVGPRMPEDTPAFVPREELREMKARDVSEVLDKETQTLRDAGVRLRLDTVYADDASTAILDYARDIDAAQVMVTSPFHEQLEKDDNESFATVIPNT
jgi:nucleotide-binding universal stress UspA family protein